MKRKMDYIIVDGEFCALQCPCYGGNLGFVEMSVLKLGTFLY